MKLKIKLFARNIVNPEVITDFISKVSKNQSDKIKVWCNTILKNYLKNEYDNLKDVTKSKKSDPDWLQEAVKRKDAQEIIIDKEFERLLIEHIFHYFDTLQNNNIKHTFPEAEKQTKEWENKENLFNIKLTKGIKEVLKCEGGYTWFEITDEETLYNEGEVLQNCLRKKQHGPKYFEQIKKNKIKIFTLRDSKGIGHVGVEYIISKNNIKQMLGKQNKNPIKVYHPFCVELITYLKCDITFNIMKLLNILILDNQVYDLYNLPENLKVKTNLDLSFFPNIKLPNNLSVRKSLILEYSRIKKLPDNLEVGWDLYLTKTKITELPDNLKVGEDLYIDKTKITKLPEDLEVGKNIYISKKMSVTCNSKFLHSKIKYIK